MTFHGRFRDVDGLPIQPKPVQRPHPPLWIGGTAPKALARAVRLGDAFIGAGSSTTATFAKAVKTVRRELAEQDKDAAQFTIGKRVYVIVDDDAGACPRAGARRTAPHLRGHAGRRDVSRFRAHRTTSCAGSREVIDAGAADGAAEPRRHERGRRPRADGTACRRSDPAIALKFAGGIPASLSFEYGDALARNHVARGRGVIQPFPICVTAFGANCRTNGALSYASRAIDGVYRITLIVCLA